MVTSWDPDKTDRFIEAVQTFADLVDEGEIDPKNVSPSDLKKQGSELSKYIEQRDYMLAKDFFEEVSEEIKKETIKKIGLKNVDKFVRSYLWQGTHLIERYKSALIDEVVYRTKQIAEFDEKKAVQYFNARREELITGEDMGSEQILNQTKSQIKKLIANPEEMILHYLE